MAFESAGDVTALQGTLQAQWSALDASFSACQLAGKIPADSPNATQWADMHSRVVAFLALEPSTLHASSQVTIGRQIQSDLQPWYARLQSLGCSDVPAPPPPPAPPQDMLGGIERIVLMIVIFEALRTLGK